MSHWIPSAIKASRVAGLLITIFHFFCLIRNVWNVGKILVQTWVFCLSRCQLDSYTHVDSTTDDRKMFVLTGWKMQKIKNRNLYIRNSWTNVTNMLNLSYSVVYGISNLYAKFRYSSLRRSPEKKKKKKKYNLQINKIWI